jgi:hypothetical protein
VLEYQTVRIADEVQTSCERATMLSYTYIVCLGACQRLVFLGQVHSKLTKINTETEHKRTETTVKLLSTHTHTSDKTQAFSRRFSVLSCPVLSTFSGQL